MHSSVYVGRMGCTFGLMATATIVHCWTEYYGTILLFGAVRAQQLLCGWPMPGSGQWNEMNTKDVIVPPKWTIQGMRFTHTIDATCRWTANDAAQATVEQTTECCVCADKRDYSIVRSYFARTFAGKGIQNGLCRGGEANGDPLLVYPYAHKHTHTTFGMSTPQCVPFMISSKLENLCCAVQMEMKSQPLFVVGLVGGLKSASWILAMIFCSRLSSAPFSPRLPTYIQSRWADAGAHSNVS